MIIVNFVILISRFVLYKVAPKVFIGNFAYGAAKNVNVAYPNIIPIAIRS